ncbi:hypothetical protein KIN20_007995 [Parelaphostrongylus tenuis]|uniref:Uncharacterized protein n=1 Tax=Parelaphostrongylus tenuis TaxID=148309 RepID=A0AAD5MPU8_PARTN|nr:hypothetical protein KIN20_007995 [Parelaphostrongylus tenuis]
MRQLVALLLLFIAQCVEQRNTTDVPSFCDEYANCMAVATKKAAQCIGDNTTTFGQNGRKHHCQGLLELHSQLQVLNNERDIELTMCVREKSDDAVALGARKIEKCKATLRKAKSSTTFGLTDRRVKRKLKKEKKEKAKSCAKDAKRLRMHCSKLGKCCSVVKDCHLQGSKRDEIGREEEADEETLRHLPCWSFKKENYSQTFEK